MSITAYGTCRYCKQRLLINIPEGEVPEDYEDDIATEECNCAEAREMADRKKSQADAYEKISKLFIIMHVKISWSLQCIRLYVTILRALVSK